MRVAGFTKADGTTSPILGNYYHPRHNTGQQSKGVFSFLKELKRKRKRT